MGTTVSGMEARATARPGRWHRLRYILAGIVAVLLLSEIGTRAIASDLPPPLQWQSYETQRKVQQIDALSKAGGAQIVFLGSSLTDVDVDPAVIDAEIGGNVRSYNAGLASSIPRMSAAWAESIIIPRLHPKMIVLGVCSYDLGGEDPNRTVFLDAFLASAGERQATGHSSFLQTLNRWVGDVSSLWHNRFELRDPETVLRAVAGRKQPGDAAAADVDPNGRETQDQYSAFVNEVRVEVKNWFLGAPDISAVEQLISYATKRHIKVVLVDMPVTSQFVAAHGHGQVDYNTYLHALRFIGQTTATPVLYYDASMRNDALFGDDIHLNHTGAEGFSATLGAALKSIYA